MVICSGNSLFCFVGFCPNFIVDSVLGEIVIGICVVHVTNGNSICGSVILTRGVQFCCVFERLSRPVDVRVVRMSALPVSFRFRRG